MPFAPYDYIILYNPYKVNNTDYTFCKIRNDYYIVYNVRWGTAIVNKTDCKNGRGEWRFEGTINGTSKVNKVKV